MGCLLEPSLGPSDIAAEEGDGWEVRRVAQPAIRETPRKLIGDLSAEQQMHKHLTAVHLQLHEWKPHIPVGLPVGSSPEF